MALDDQSGAALHEQRQFLSFALDDEVFAIDVRRVREILDRTDTTRVPRMPEFMRGVLNVRGAVVPIVDLRVKFGMAPATPTVDTCVVIAEVVVDDEVSVVGALVDKVLEVFELPTDALEPPPRIGAKLDASFIHAMARREDEVFIVLDIDRVLSVDEVIALRRASSERGGKSGKSRRSKKASVTSEEAQGPEGL